MAPNDLELVRTIYERFRAGATDAALELFDPAVEIRERDITPDPAVHRRREGVMDTLRDSRSAFEGLDFVPEEFLAVDDYVVVVFRFRGTGRGSGIPVDERLAHLWKIRNGKVIRMSVHSGREEAMRAAGTGEAPATNEGTRDSG